MREADRYEAFFRLDTGTHTAPIRQLEPTPDGRCLISAGETTIRVWDLSTRQMLRQLLGPIDDRGNGSVRRFAISPDSRWLVALKDWRLPPRSEGDAGRVTDVQVFELATGNLQAAFRHPGLLHDLGFSADGQSLAWVGNRRQGRKRQALLQVLRARDVLNARFGQAPTPVAEHVWHKAPAGADLRTALRRVPADGAGTRISLWAVATQAQGQPGELAWFSFQRQKGLEAVRSAVPPTAIEPGTLACSATYAVVAGRGSPRPDGRYGQFMHFKHEGELLGQTLTESRPCSLSFSDSGRQLVVGLSIDTGPSDALPPDDTQQALSSYGKPAPSPEPQEAPQTISEPLNAYDSPPLDATETLDTVGAQIVQVNVYAVGADAFDLHCSYFGHDGNLTALALLSDGTVLSSGGDNHAIHAWSAEHRVGVFKWALRGLGRTCYAPGINLDEKLLFGVLPPRLLPPNHAERQQSFDLRSMQLKTTCPSDVHADDFETDKWFIVDQQTQTLELRYAPDAFGEQANWADLTLFVGADDEWVLWSPSGYYDASPGGAKRAGYHVNRGPDKEALFFPADRFKAFYRPDLIRAIVQHGSEARARAAGVDIPKPKVVEALPPIVEMRKKGIAVEPGRVTLSFSAQQLVAGNPVRRVWIVGNEGFLWESPAISGKPKALTHYAVTLPLRQGRNTFSICAESASAKAVPLVCRVDESDLALPAQDATTLEPAGNLYLLSVGVSNFAVAGTPLSGGFKALKYPHQDAIAVYNAFAKSKRGNKAPSIGPYRNPVFAEVHAKLLIDEEATKANILAALTDLCGQIRARSQVLGSEPAPRDVLMVYLSGHGTRFKGEQDLYFFSYDLVPETMDQSGLSMLEVGRLLTSVAAEVVLVMDTCHAASAGDDVVSSLSPEELGQRIHALNEKGLYVLSAARTEEIARENPVTGLGVFTSALLGTLERTQFLRPVEQRGKTRRLSMLGLMHGVETLVPFFTTQARKKPQTPVCRTYGDLLPLDIYQRSSKRG
jgi:WD40 repeat protein